VLDAYLAAGGNFIDTADSYSVWVEGNKGGESEAIIGGWMAKRRNREQLVIATKVGRDGLAAESIQRRAEESLARLQTDYIDLYYAHYDDTTTDLEESLDAFDGLVREGKVRYVAASNYGAGRLADALRISRDANLTGYVALQTHYNLLERDGYEDELADLCADEGLPCLPYYALAQGFLTGKYRSSEAEVESPRAIDVQVYESERGDAVLDALHAIAQARATTMAAVSLAWLLAQPTVATPITSARSVEQLEQLLPAVDLQLTGEELSRLDLASSFA
jgi:aryl-alcohol dehydrogenase (NADP+)